MAASSELPRKWQKVPDILPFQPVPSSRPELEHTVLTAIARQDILASPEEVDAAVMAASITLSFLRGAVTQCNGEEPFVTESAALHCRSSIGPGIFFDVDCWDM
jgi:hypothetical protein